MKKSKSILPRLRNEKGRFIEKAKARFFYELTAIEKKIPLNRWGKIKLTKTQAQEIQKDAQTKFLENKNLGENIFNGVEIDYLGITGTIKNINEATEIEIQTPKQVYNVDRLKAIYLIQRYETIMKNKFQEIAQVIIINEIRGKKLKLICK